MRSSATVKAQYAVLDLRADQLDHPEWQRAQPVQIRHYWSGEAAPQERWADARLLWSDKALAVRFVCVQKEPMVVSFNSQTATKTLGLWDRDVCEIFLAPDPTDVHRYFEFEAAPTGEWIDLAISWKQDGRETDSTFESGMTVAAKTENELVTIGMRIPWSDSICKPVGGDQWRVNLFRCVGAGENRGYLSWQPTLTQKPNFHVPEVFGCVTFVEG